MSSVVIIVRMLSAEIIAIGSELLSLRIARTPIVSGSPIKLNRIGIDVRLKTVVGDDDARLEEIDQRRRQAFARGYHHRRAGTDRRRHHPQSRSRGRWEEGWRLDEKVLEEIRERFRSFGIANMPERNSRQAMVISGARGAGESERFRRPGSFLNMKAARSR